MESSSLIKVINRVYLEDQRDQSKRDMKDLLNSVVYFMSKNYKAHTAVGYLATEAGDRFLLNSVVTASPNFDRERVIELGKGVIGTAAEDPEIHPFGSLGSSAESPEYYFAGEKIRSLMLTRIIDKRTKALQGLLVVDSESENAFTQEHRDMMPLFAQVASAVITSANLTYEMNKHAIQTSIQYEIAQKLSDTMKPEDVINILTESLTRALEYDRVVICSYSTSAGKGNIWWVIGDPGYLMDRQEFEIGHPGSLYGRAFLEREAFLTQDYRANKQYVRFDHEEPPADRPQEIMIAPIHDDKNAVWAVIGIESNRTGTYSQAELKLLKTVAANATAALTKARMYAEMEKLATMDGLTHIANHRRFQDLFSAELERSQRYGTSATLLLLDIDHFKKVNDTYGHPVGDMILQAVAKTLQSSIRGTDYCARYGGEEFVVILIQADESQSLALAERVRKAVENLQIRHEDKVLKATVSIGAASFPQDGRDKQSIIDNADKAMYFSKHKGRNRVTFYSQLKPKSFRLTGWLPRNRKKYL